MSHLEWALGLIATLALGLAVVFVPIGLMVLIYTLRRRRLPPGEPPAVEPGFPGLGADDQAHVRALVDRGDRIEAVRFVRRQTGYGVADADNTVRRLTDS